MEWQQIIGFYYTAKLKSFTKAAEATFRTQPALSQQIASLEQELKSPLFERIGKKSLKLTPQGELLFIFAESVLTQHRILKDKISGLASEDAGHLSIAAPFTTLYHLFPEPIKRFCGTYPHIELTVLDRPQESVLSMVRDGSADIGIVLESAAPRDVNILRWKSVETVLIVPADHPLSHQQTVKMRDVAKYPLILPPKGGHSRTREKIESELKKTGQEYRIAMESSNVELSSAYVENGFGVSFATVVRDIPLLRGRRLVFIALPRLFKCDHIAIVTGKGRKLSSRVSAFIELLMESTQSFN